MMEDLSSTLQALASSWTEGMKIDCVLLANLSLLQRDSFLSLLDLSPQLADGWRSQPFCSEHTFGGTNVPKFQRVFGDPPTSRPDPQAPRADMGLRIFTSSSEATRLDPADRVLFASEVTCLRDALPTD